MSKPRSSQPVKEPSRRMSLRHVPSIVSLIRGPSSSGSGDVRQQGASQSRRQSLTRATASSLAKMTPFAKKQPESFLPRPRHHSLNNLLAKRRSLVATPPAAAIQQPRPTLDESPPPVPSKSNKKNPGPRMESVLPSQRHPQRAWPAFGLLPHKIVDKNGYGPIPNMPTVKPPTQQQPQKQRINSDITSYGLHCPDAYSSISESTPTAVVPLIAGRRSSLADLSDTMSSLARRSSQPSLGLPPCHRHHHHHHHPSSTGSRNYGYMRRSKCAACSSKGRRRSLSQSNSAFESVTCASPLLKHQESSDSTHTVTHANRQPPAPKAHTPTVPEEKEIHHGRPETPTTPTPTKQLPFPQQDTEAPSFNAQAMAVAAQFISKTTLHGTETLSAEQRDRLLTSSERLERLSHDLLGSERRVAALLKSHLAMTPAGHEERSRACEALVQTQQQVLNEMKALLAACSPPLHTPVAIEPEEQASTETPRTIVTALPIPESAWKKSVDESMTRMRWSLSRLLGGSAGTGQVIAGSKHDPDFGVVITGTGITIEQSLLPEHLRGDKTAPVFLHHYVLHLDEMERQDKYSLLPENQWIRDRDVERCEFELDGPCAAEFDWLQRRHHCRRCGHLFCNTHSANRLPLFKPLDDTAHWSRVCDTCFYSLVGPHLQPQ